MAIVTVNPLIAALVGKYRQFLGKWFPSNMPMDGAEMIVFASTYLLSERCVVGVFFRLSLSEQKTVSNWRTDQRTAWFQMKKKEEDKRSTVIICLIMKDSETLNFRSLRGGKMKTFNFLLTLNLKSSFHWLIKQKSQTIQTLKATVVPHTSTRCQQLPSYGGSGPVVAAGSWTK